MNRPRCTSGALLACVCLLGTLATHAVAKPTLGFADEKSSIFADPRLTDLHVTRARRTVAWDVLSDPGGLASLDAWMAGAEQDHVRPLLVFKSSGQEGRASINPTANQMTQAIKGLRARYPGQVHDVSTWNEANIAKRATLVATWYRALRRGCSACTVLGADVVDKPNVIRWSRQFAHAAKRTPIWGLHNYVDVNNYASKRTLAFAARLEGDIWLTETGGVLSRERGQSHFAGTGERHAAKATRYLLDHLVDLRALRHRIKRVYLYSWSSAPNDTSWDSGMIGPDGRERSMLTVVRRYLHRKRVPRPATPPPPSTVLFTPAD